jgi:hypothetical protein
MRIVSEDRAAWFATRRIGTNVSRDIHAKVGVPGYGFEGSNRSVWFERSCIDVFLKSLDELEHTRQGVAALESMSPEECRLLVENTDRLGHMRMVVVVSRCVFAFGQTDHLRCRIQFDIDPTALPQAVRALRDELS